MNRHAEWEGHQGPVLEGQGEYKVIACQACGFAHIIPIPDAASLGRMYQKKYYSEMIPDYIERHTQDQAWWDQVHASRLKTLESLLSDGGRRILDIGTGPGGFLRAARDRGWEGLGFEPSEQACRHCVGTLGLNVRQEFFTRETDLGEGAFDAVHMSDVLEHIRDPLAMLRAVRRVLRPGGACCVAVPNDFNPIQTALRRDRGFSPWWVSTPDHINYFTFESLQRLLERGGFEVRQREASFPLDVFLLLGIDYTDDDALGRQCHGWRMRLERTLYDMGLGEALADVYRALAKHDLGRHAVLYATARGGAAAPEER